MCRTSERIPMIRFLDDGTHPGARGPLQSTSHLTVHQMADLVSQTERGHRSTFRQESAGDGNSLMTTQRRIFSLILTLVSRCRRVRRFHRQVSRENFSSHSVIHP